MNNVVTLNFETIKTRRAACKRVRVTRHSHGELIFGAQYSPCFFKTTARGTRFYKQKHNFERRQNLSEEINTYKDYCNINYTK